MPAARSAPEHSAAHLAGAAGLLFVSGACALVYQTMWIRALRVVFGASTPATAAVLAIFMGGLGLGAALLGRRGERTPRPLLFYGALELGVAAFAAVSPLLISLVDVLYRATGGAAALGPFAATLVRLLLATLAIGVPAVLMGGTLPALGRAVVGADDRARRSLALVYGTNALGAVTGCALSMFVLLAAFGVRGSVWVAAGVNALVALIAIVLGLRAEPRPPTDTVRARVPGQWTLLVLAFVAGCAFFMLELVWYRMTAPILGGSTYTFGIVLGAALAGIGIGGALYAAAPPRAPSMHVLAVTFALEAALTLVPYALGDRIARLAYFLRELGEASFASMAFGWSVIACVIVMPAAVVAGWQFSVLVALKGSSGDAAEGVAVDTGDVYAANTAGAIVGSLAGGFGLLPLLSAPGLWQVAALSLVVVVVPFLLVGRPGSGALRATGAVFAVAAVALATATGPSPLWRHSGIGAGRADLHATTARELRMITNTASRNILWEREGIESSLAARADTQTALFVNGKSDGGGLSDAPNMIGLGLLPAILHGDVKRAFVIGLGSGETAGWLAHVPTIEGVDVAELEPDVLEFARLSAAVNRDMLDNPKVRVLIGDGRELLATGNEQLDLIVSEPSNPYREGVAGLYTRDFYERVADRLADGGLFGQWLQVYEIDGPAFRTVLATLDEVFPYVSVWRLETSDALLLASREPITVDVDRVDAALAVEPWSTWSRRIGRFSGAEGILAMHVATPDAVARFAGFSPWNSDDRPLLELSVARTVGLTVDNPLVALESKAQSQGEDLPIVVGRDVDRERVVAQRGRPFLAGGDVPPVASVEGAWAVGDTTTAAAMMKSEDAATFIDLTGMLARAHIASMRATGAEDREALHKAIAMLARTGMPSEAAVIRVHELITDRDDRMLSAFADALALARVDPWLPPALVRSMLARVGELALEPDAAREALALLASGPLAGHNSDVHRAAAMLRLVERATTEAGPPPECVSVFVPIEPHPHWTVDALAARARCYDVHDPARAPAARADLAEARGASPAP